MNMKNAVFWDVMQFGFCNNIVLEERIASIIKVKRISELGITLALTSNCSTLQRFREGFFAVLQLQVTANFVSSSPILFTRKKEAILPPKRRFLQEPHGVTFQKAAFSCLNVDAKASCVAAFCSSPLLQHWQTISKVILVEGRS
jgi:hypothetical protein